MVTVSRTARAFKAMHSQLSGDPVANGEAAYEAWAAIPNLIPVSVREAMAPKVSVAKYRANLGLAQQAPWGWDGLVDATAKAIVRDSRLAFVEDGTAGQENTWLTPHLGFLVDVGWSYGQADADVTLTTVGMAFRLQRDVVVYGRVMLSADDDATHYSYLPCDFNAGGRPNRRADRVGNAELTANFADLVDCGPITDNGGLPVFTHDGDPAAEWWTLDDVLLYLQWFYNANETWIANWPVVEAETSPEVQASVEGMNLWMALFTVCDRVGVDVWESFANANDGTGLPTSSIAVLARGEGTVRTIKRQTWTPGAALAQVDLDQTNLFAAEVAESHASAVTRPIVAGGANLREVTVELKPVWDPGKLLGALPGGEFAMDSARMQTYWSIYKRYHVEGDEFDDYKDVGRLWDANTDGRYSGAPYSQDMTDLADLCSETALSWPRMNFKPFVTLTRQGNDTSGESQQFLVEWSPDTGDTWYKLAGCRVLPDRLGIYITQPNLGDILEQAPDATTPKLPTFQHNLLYRLLTAPANVRVRLTCVIATPQRNIEQPAQQASAGTKFEQAAWYDRGGLGESRQVVTGSKWAGSGSLVADESDAFDALALANQAARLQDVLESRFVEARFMLEWPDEQIGLSDVIQQISGIGYSLQTNTGAGAAYPRVVGRTLHVTPDSYAMELVLDTDRKASVR